MVYLIYFKLIYIFSVVMVVRLESGVNWVKMVVNGGSLDVL